MIHRLRKKRRIFKARRRENQRSENMIDAIVYTSNTGYTEKYAKMLGEKTDLPVFSLKEAEKQLAKDGEILYLGWMMAGKIQGCDKAAQRYRVAAVCGVCMGATGSQIEDARKATKLPEDLPVFTMQGGFDMKKLRGTYKMMMSVMAKTVGKKLKNKADRTPEEDQMLEMLFHGGDFVREENTEAVMEWYNGYRNNEE